MKAAAAVAGAVLALAVTPSADAARNPTSREQAVLTQAIAQLFQPSWQARNPKHLVTRPYIRITTIGADSGRVAYAVFHLMNSNGTDFGFAEAVFIRFRHAGISQWLLVSGPGTVHVGCDVSLAAYLGDFRAVLRIQRDLEMNCP